MKRVLALALVLMMAISIALPITALAESNENELKYYLVSYGTGIFNEDYIMSRTDNTEFEEYVIRDVNLYANKPFYIYIQLTMAKKPLNHIPVQEPDSRLIHLF